MKTYVSACSFCYKNCMALKLSLEESAFNEIDELVLCRISYLNFDGLPADCDFFKKITLSELAEQFKTLRNRLLINQLTVKLMFDAAAYRGTA